MPKQTASRAYTARRVTGTGTAQGVVSVGFHTARRFVALPFPEEQWEQQRITAKSTFPTLPPKPPPSSSRGRRLSLQCPPSLPSSKNGSTPPRPPRPPPCDGP